MLNVETYDNVLIELIQQLVDSSQQILEVTIKLHPDREPYDTVRLVKDQPVVRYQPKPEQLDWDYALKA